MDISKRILEGKLFENGFSELIKSADEAQGAKPPSHISLQSEVSLNEAYSDGTRLSELSHSRQSSHLTLYAETIKDSPTQKFHSKTVGVDSCYNEDNFEIKLTPKFTSNSPSNSESSTATEDRTASLPIIVIVRVKNEFILNVANQPLVLVLRHPKGRCLGANLLIDSGTGTHGTTDRVMVDALLALVGVHSALVDRKDGGLMTLQRLLARPTNSVTGSTGTRRASFVDRVSCSRCSCPMMLPSMADASPICVSCLSDEDTAVACWR